MEKFSERGAKKRPAVFFDRDGTLIDDIGYLDDPARLSFYPGVPEALQRLRTKGYVVVVITNQSGIGRGYFDEETAIMVNLRMVQMLRRSGAQPDAVYYCPHHPDEGCSCRKPCLLMVYRALED
ncbi:MAG: HAD-IIIA family hydrolase, partial [Pseudomonadota bacterium]